MCTDFPFQESTAFPLNGFHFLNPILKLIYRKKQKRHFLKHKLLFRQCNHLHWRNSKIKAYKLGF